MSTGDFSYAVFAMSGVAGHRSYRPLGTVVACDAGDALDLVCTSFGEAARADETICVQCTGQAPSLWERIMAADAW